MPTLRDRIRERFDDDEDRVDGQELEPLHELGSDDRLLRGLLLAFAQQQRAESHGAEPYQQPTEG